VALDIDLELPRAHELGLVGLSACAPEQRLGPRHQLLGVKRFGQIVVGADLQADHLVGDLIAGREHDDRHLALLADLLADGQAVGAGEHDVEDHQVGLDLAEPRYRLGAVPHPLDLIAFAGQIEPGQLDDVLFIVDDQDPRAHCRAHDTKFITVTSAACLTNVSEL